MSRPRSVKIIAFYAGPRRSFPHNSQEALQLLEYILKREMSVDPGVPMDSIIVHNQAEQTETSPWFQWIKARLAQVNGQPSKRGTLRVISRPNEGFSFGAYNFAFAQFRRHYDYWFFTEDDIVMVRHGYFAAAQAQLAANPDVGFIAAVGVCGTFACGGVGFAHSAVLQKVVAANLCPRHPKGHLPYHISESYEEQEVFGEIRFTQAIVDQGFTLEPLRGENWCCCWRRGMVAPQAGGWVCTSLPSEFWIA